MAVCWTCKKETVGCPRSEYERRTLTWCPYYIYRPGSDEPDPDRKSKRKSKKN